MTSTPCPHGRLQAANLAAMNLRAVVGPYDVTYLAPPPRRLAAVKHAVGPRFQPRNEFGQFSTYAGLNSTINLRYAWTAYEYDLEDEARPEDEAFAAELEALAEEAMVDEQDESGSVDGPEGVHEDL